MSGENRNLKRKLTLERKSLRLSSRERDKEFFNYSLLQKEERERLKFQQKIVRQKGKCILPYKERVTNQQRQRDKRRYKEKYREQVVPSN